GSKEYTVSQRKGVIAEREIRDPDSMDASCAMHSFNLRLFLRTGLPDSITKKTAKRMIPAARIQKTAVFFPFLSVSAKFLPNILSHHNPSQTGLQTAGFPDCIHNP